MSTLAPARRWQPPRSIMRARLATKNQAPFAPTDVAGIVAWYDANDSNTLSLSGSTVTQWNDKSGNGYNLTRGNGTNGPSSGTRSVNGHNCLDFNRATFMPLDNASLAIAAQPVTIFAVVGKDDTSNTMFVTDGLGAGGRCIIAVEGSNAKPELFAGSFTNSTATDDTTVRQYSAVFNGASSGFWQDGASKSTANPGAGSLTAGIRLGGSRDGTGANLDGALCEVIVYNTAVGTTDRQTIEAYLKLKWATP